MQKGYDDDGGGFLCFVNSFVCRKKNEIFFQLL